MRGEDLGPGASPPGFAALPPARAPPPPGGLVRRLNAEAPEFQPPPIGPPAAGVNALREQLEKLDVRISEEESQLTGGISDPLLAAKFRPLSKDEEFRIDEQMKRPMMTLIRMEYNIPMKVQDLTCLAPGVWLNDEVMNYWLNMIRERSIERIQSPTYPEKHQCQVVCMQTFFWTKLYNKGGYNYKGVRRWTKTSKLKGKCGHSVIFSLDALLFPVHVNDTHWCAGVINFKKKRIEYYDSLGGLQSKFFEFCMRYLKDESLDKCKKPFDDSGWTLYNPSDCPRQENGCDCGVFTLKALEWAAEGREVVGAYSQEEMPYFRRRILSEILEGRLGDA